jgi:benzoyl-CoA reductase/2-hydroxyglutaryl-CoA dehydratase subunit BcrC/BadD/HgdB
MGMCPFARSFAEYAAGLDDRTAVVFTTTCDQMRRAADLVALRRSGPVFLLNVPATRGELAERMYVAELERFGRFLQAIGERPGHLKPPAPRLDCERQRGDAVRLAVVGSPIPELTAFERDIERLGGSLVLDASDSGERTRPATIDPDTWRINPLVALARAYLAMPAIHQRPNDRLLTWLTAEVVRRDIQGVILRRYVWCDLWHAMSPCIRESIGVPVLDIEVDADATVSSPRLSTRISAFIEMLRTRNAGATGT